MGKNIGKMLLITIIASVLVSAPVKGAETTDTSIGIEAPHAVLMEASTGTILYEKDAKGAVSPASVTKIMTMLLIFEALEENKIKLEDDVVVSEKAASMGGSQVFFEPGEEQTVDTMLKCIAIASANDACVAMAEYVSGSEEAFVNKMNQRAKELGMDNTNFVNCNGLDVEGHGMSAYDVALVSRELIEKHPQVHNYCTVWMDTIVHKTAKGSQEFGLSNTNKLIRQYEYSTGLKTGSTSEAGFCVSATAEKNGMKLIAVIMDGETSKSRFQDATTLLNYGFANYQIYSDTDAQREPLGVLPVNEGVTETVELRYAEEFHKLLLNGENISSIEKRIEIPEEVTAPINKDEMIGKLYYYYEQEKIGEVNVVAVNSVEKAKYSDYVRRVWLAWMM